MPREARHGGPRPRDRETGGMADEAKPHPARPRRDAVSHPEPPFRRPEHDREQPCGPPGIRSDHPALRIIPPAVLIRGSAMSNAARPPLSGAREWRVIGRGHEVIDVPT